MGDRLQIDRNKIKELIILVVFHILYVLPIILANRYYQDDLARSLYGFSGWNGDGRPLTELVIKFLGGMSGSVMDIAPMPLLLSILLISVALFCYGNKYCRFNQSWIITSLGLFLFSFNPFMIYSFSYKYDVISMSLSIVIVLLAYACAAKISWWKKIIVNTGIGIAVMMLYQPTLGLTLALVCISFLLWLFDKIDSKTLMSDIWIAVGNGIGAIIYKIAIVGFFITEESGDWRYAASQTVQNGLLGNIKQILINLVGMIYYIEDFYKYNVPSLYKLVMLCFVIVVQYYCVILYWHREKKSIIGAGYIIMAPFICLCVSCVPLALLNDMGIRGRLFISFGTCLLLVGCEFIYVINSLKNRLAKIIIMMLCLFLCMYHMSFMYMYGNASSSQQEYERYLAYSIASDIECENKTDEVSLKIIGEAPYSPEVKMMCERYPALRELVPTYINNNWWIGGAWLARYIKDEVSYLDGEYDMSSDIMVTKCEKVSDNTVYKMYVVGKDVIVEFQ